MSGAAEADYNVVLVTYHDNGRAPEVLAHGARGLFANVLQVLDVLDSVQMRPSRC